MTDQKFAFLCGTVAPGSQALLSIGIIRLKNHDMNGEAVEIKVSQNDPGLAKISPGKKRMVIAKEGKIIAVFGRPRIKLLRMLERGADLNQDLIDCFSPMYPKPEKVFRTTQKWKNTQECRDQKDYQAHRMRKWIYGR